MKRGRHDDAVAAGVGARCAHLRFAVDVPDVATAFGYVPSEMARMEHGVARRAAVVNDIVVIVLDDSGIGVAAIDLVAALLVACVALGEVLGLLLAGCVNDDTCRPRAVAVLLDTRERTFPRVVGVGWRRETQQCEHCNDECEELIHGKTSLCLPVFFVYYYIILLTKSKGFTKLSARGFCTHFLF